MRIPISASCWLALAAAVAPAQETDPIYVHVQLRVSTNTDAGVLIDRGARDLLEAGDRVLLFPRAGGTFRATVVAVDQQSSVIRLDETGRVPPPGTRGEVLVPRARVSAARGDPDPADPDPAPPREPVTGAEPRPDWPAREDGWQEGMPLLAKVRPVRPEERGSRVTGRVWTMGDLVQVPAPDDRAGDRFANSIARVGTDIRADNLFGAGGTLRFDGELNHRTRADESEAGDLLVRTLSYRLGGDRFAPNQWQFGRFLSSEMPEFGTVDGIEYVRRSPAGHRYGASFGFLPEVDDCLTTGEDLQVAGFFHYAADDLERLSFDVGYQKSFHGGKADRDLFVLKSRYLPGDGWDLIGTAWIDYYYGRDDAKGSGLELTQAFFAATRRLDDGSGYELAWRRHRFPETLRDDFVPPYLDQLADARSDRLSLEAWTGGAARAHGLLFGWDDENAGGAGAEAGIGFTEVLLDGDDLDVTLFGTLGEFANVAGLRLTLGRTTTSGRWDLFYEFANHHLLERDADSDDLQQHRLRFSQAFFLGAGWNASLHGEGLLYDQDLSWSAGFHLQKSF
jgi:hypothetical protein